MKSVYFGIANGIVTQSTYNSDGFDVGSNPSCALNQQNQFLEVHQSQGADNNLYYWSGSVTGSELVLPVHGPVAQPGTSVDSGCNPSVALNNQGVVVEAHDSGHNTLWWWLGQAANGDVVWQGHGGINYSGKSPDSGYDPAIAVNDSNVVVEIHNSGPAENTLWWWLGQVAPRGNLWVRS